MRPAALQHTIKHEAHREGRRVVYARGGRQVAGAGKEERPVDGAEPLAGRELLFEEVGEDGQQGADPKVVQQPRVDLADAVEAGGADGAPDDGGREVDAALWAGVAVGLVGRADVFDVAEHPEEDGVCGGGGR